jgi:hypothetical protein
MTGLMGIDGTISFSCPLVPVDLFLIGDTDDHSVSAIRCETYVDNGLMLGSLYFILDLTIVEKQCTSQGSEHLLNPALVESGYVVSCGGSRVALLFWSYDLPPRTHKISKDSCVYNLTE